MGIIGEFATENIHFRYMHNMVEEWVQNWLVVFWQ